jgi:endo-1,3-1,4-beta-glycanase ExoK
MNYDEKFKSMIVPLAVAAVFGGHHEVRADGGASFVEDFDKLSVQRWYVSDGWTNGAHQNCYWTKSNVRIRSGVLQLHFNQGSSRFQCAELQSREIFSYGTFEVRMRAPEPTSGFNAAFFTYTGPHLGTRHDEIDVELLMRQPPSAWLNVHMDGDGTNGVNIQDQPLSAQFNDYAFVWKPEKLEWFINGKSVRIIDDPDKVPVTPQKIYASLWSSDTLVDWMGAFEIPSMPYFMEIDRISYTRLGDTCQFNGSVACTAN